MLNVIDQILQKKSELEEKALLLDDMPPLELAYTNGETNQTVDDKREESEEIEKGETTVLTQNPVMDDMSDDLELLSLDLVRNKLMLHLVITCTVQVLEN